MEKELADGEFWLPPEFLTDEDILMDFTTAKPTSNLYAYPNLTSPDTESDEEDYYVNGLTRNLANFNFDNDYSKATGVVAGSPQSTLCGCKYGSSRGSPNCSSPPEDNRKQTSWDLLYAAAGELARIRMLEEAASRYYNPNNIGTHDLHYQQLQVAQFQKLKQQQIAKQYMQMMMVNRSRSGIGSGPPPQRHPGTGMRAVFLGNPNNTKRESSGTGVFLPRQTGAATEPAKKRGCSTVLLPDRLVRALNLNLENMEGESKVRFNHDAEIMHRQSVIMSQQRRNSHRQQPPAAMSEFRLPQEWTY